MYYFLFHSQGNPSFLQRGFVRRHSIDEGGSPPCGAWCHPVPSRFTLKDLPSSVCIICVYKHMYVWIIPVCRFNKVIVWLQRFCLGLFHVNFKGMRNVQHGIILVSSWSFEVWFLRKLDFKRVFYVNLISNMFFLIQCGTISFLCIVSRLTIILPVGKQWCDRR